MLEELKGKNEIKDAILELSSSANGITAYASRLQTNQATGGRNYEQNTEEIRKVARELDVLAERLKNIV